MSEPIAVILAAGEGKRMGLPKALLEHDGRTFLATLISTFNKAGCGCVAVVGKHADEIRAYKPRCDLVVNGEWEKGQFSSVKAGLAAALEQEPSVVLVQPVDVPMVRATTVKTLLASLNGHDAAVPEFEGAAGHPLVMTAAAAKKVLAADAPHLEAAQKALKVARVKTRDPAVIVDLNTPDVYERVIGAKPKLAAPPRPRTKAK